MQLAIILALKPYLHQFNLTKREQMLCCIDHIINLAAKAFFIEKKEVFSAKVWYEVAKITDIKK